MLPSIEYIKTLVNGLKQWVENRVKSVRKELTDKVEDLPQADWDQNDPEARDYVKNRPFYVATETWMPFTIENWRTSGWLLEAFKIDGVEYRDISKTSSSGVSTIIAGKYTITVNFRNNSLACSPEYSSLLFWYEHDVVHQIDEAFIPNRNFNILNGMAEGSLRMALAKEENDSYSLGESSFAEGDNTTASGRASHAEGDNTTASGRASHAEGDNTTASGRASHAEGENTTASGDASHAEGDNTTASGNASHAEGENTTASRNASHAEGDNTTASGHASHAEGDNTTASGDASHVRGRYNIVEDGEYSYDMIVDTTLQIRKSSTDYVFGTDLKIDLNSGKCILSDKKSLVPAIGIKDCYIQPADETVAYWVFSSKQNPYVSSNIECKVTKFNVGRYVTPAYTNYATIIGNGISDAKRSNAHTLDWDGNAWFSGDVYTGSTSGTNRDDGSKKLATEEYVDSQKFSGSYNDLTDRPGGYIEFTTVLDKTFATGDFQSAGDNLYQVTFTPSQAFAVGNTYNVACNGTKYEDLVAEELDGGILIGEIGDSAPGFTNYPFCIYVKPDGTNLIYQPSASAMTVLVEEQTVVKIPTKYLPDLPTVTPFSIDSTASDYSTTSTTYGDQVKSALLGGRDVWYIGAETDESGKTVTKYTKVSWFNIEKTDAEAKLIVGVGARTDDNSGAVTFAISV